MFAVLTGYILSYILAVSAVKQEVRPPSGSAARLLASALLPCQRWLGSARPGCARPSGHALASQLGPEWLPLPLPLPAPAPAPVLTMPLTLPCRTQYALKIDQLLVSGSALGERRRGAAAQRGGQARPLAAGRNQPAHGRPPGLPSRAQWALKERGVPSQLRDRIIDYVQVGCTGLGWARASRPARFTARSVRGRRRLGSRPTPLSACWNPRPSLSCAPPVPCLAVQVCRAARGSRRGGDAGAAAHHPRAGEPSSGWQRARHPAASSRLQAPTRGPPCDPGVPLPVPAPSGRWRCCRAGTCWRACRCLRGTPRCWRRWRRCCSDGSRCRVRARARARARCPDGGCLQTMKSPLSVPGLQPAAGLRQPPTAPPCRCPCQAGQVIIQQDHVLSAVWFVRRGYVDLSVVASDSAWPGTAAEGCSHEPGASAAAGSSRLVDTLGPEDFFADRALLPAPKEAAKQVSGGGEGHSTRSMPRTACHGHGVVWRGSRCARGCAPPHRRPALDCRPCLPAPAAPSAAGSRPAGAAAGRQLVARALHRHSAQPLRAVHAAGRGVAPRAAEPC